MPKRKSITSEFIDSRAFTGEIWPVTRTAIAPNSITCQICSLIFPIRLVAIRTKTIARTISGIITVNDERGFGFKNLSTRKIFFDALKLSARLSSKGRTLPQPTNDGPQVGGTSVKRRKTPTFKRRV